MTIRQLCKELFTGKYPDYDAARIDAVANIAMLAGVFSSKDIDVELLPEAEAELRSSFESVLVWGSVIVDLHRGGLIHDPDIAAYENAKERVGIERN
jgi:hypothetical protein